MPFFTRYIFLILIFSSACSTSPILYGVRIGLHEKNSIRIVLDVEKPVSYKIEGAPGTFIFLHIQGNRAENFKQVNQAIPIKSIKIIEESETVKIHLKCQYKYALKKQFSLPKRGEQNFRHVIDLIRYEETMSSDGVIASAAPILPTRKKIIIDAGHGGRDPGTYGKNHSFEKHLTLKIAQQLAKKLETTGKYNCVLTRHGDYPLTLAKRLRRIRQEKGDLFLSIHADSHSHHDTRGLSIYTLSAVASDREAARLAQKENKADINLGIDFKNELPEISDILIDLTKRETMNLSTTLAKGLLKELSRNVFLLRHPHRFADFVVLRSPDIPSVLIELGFLSNPKDEELLMSKSYQEKICSSITKGIDHYFQKFA